MRKSVLTSMVLALSFAGVACGPEMEGKLDLAEPGEEPAVAAVEQGASTVKTATVVMNSSSCGVATQISCAAMVRHCIPLCVVDSNSGGCKFCIEQTFTFGIDCWSCLYNRGSSAGGSYVPPPEYYSCRSFPAGDADDTRSPRYRSSTSKIQEMCNPPVYDRRTRRWTKWCCLYRVR